MAESNPREEILKSPEFPWLILGDGCEALWQGATEITNEDGITMIQAIIKPTSNFDKAYNIQPTQKNKHGQIIVNFAKNDLIHLGEFNPYLHKIIYTKSYNHDDTPLSLREKNLQIRLNELQKRLWTMEGNIIKLGEELRTSKNNPQESLASTLELIEKLSNSIGTNRGRNTQDGPNY